MPILNNQGWSEETSVKHQHFRDVMLVHMSITKAIINKHWWTSNEYLYVDINPGDGGCIGNAGSPLLATSIAQSKRLPYRALCIEIDPCNADALASRMPSESLVVCGDHLDILPQYIQHPPVKDRQGKTDGVFGLLFSDPNGTEPPWELLAQFSEAYPRVDILVYMSATNFKRVRRSAEIMGVEKPYLTERLNSVGKEVWIAREKRAQHEWTFLLGTNWRGLDRFRRSGFHPVIPEDKASATGARILAELTYTTQERIVSQQLALPFLSHPTEPIRNT